MEKQFNFNSLTAEQLNFVQKYQDLQTELENHLKEVNQIQIDINNVKDSPENYDFFQTKFAELTIKKNQLKSKVYEVIYKLEQLRDEEKRLYEDN